MEFCAKKKSQTHRTQQVQQFSLWASFLAFHSVVVFMITVCVFLSILFGHFHRSIHLFCFHLCIDEQHNLDDIFVSKFGFKLPNQHWILTKFLSMTRLQERRRKTLPRNYTHPKKSMVHATFCSLMLERYAQVSVWRQTTGWFWLHQFRKSVLSQAVDRSN